MSGSKSAKAQKIILEEIKKQLILQAERWGRKDYYTPLRLEETELLQCRKIVGELFTEKANLEYELHLLESNKSEVVQKIERLDLYLKRAAKVTSKHERSVSQIIQKTIGNEKEIQKAVTSIKRKPLISILISDN